MGMVSLLDLVTREKELQKLYDQYQEGKVTESITLETLIEELGTVRVQIDQWGRQSNTVYRIC